MNKQGSLLWQLSRTPLLLLNSIVIKIAILLSVASGLGGCIVTEKPAILIGDPMPLANNLDCLSKTSNNLAFSVEELNSTNHSYGQRSGLQKAQEIIKFKKIESSTNSPTHNKYLVQSTTGDGATIYSAIEILSDHEFWANSNSDSLTDVQKQQLSDNFGVEITRFSKNGGGLKIAGSGLRVGAAMLSQDLLEQALPIDHDRLFTCSPATPPVVKVLSPSEGAKFSSEDITLHYILNSPSNLKVDEIVVLIDGRTPTVNGRIPTGNDHGEVTPPALDNKSDVREGDIKVKLPLRDVMVGLQARSGALLSAASQVHLVYKPTSQIARSSASDPPNTGSAEPPYAFVDFCKREPDDSNCVATSEPIGKLTLNLKVWKALNQVNYYVNKTVRPVTDLKQYGKDDYWTYPNSGAGDCEDYALLKKRYLENLYGIPANMMSIAVVLDEKGDGHAVLLVATDKGYYSLDNRRPNILLWNETRYTFLKRTNPHNPMVWIRMSYNPNPPK